MPSDWHPCRMSDRDRVDVPESSQTPELLGWLQSMDHALGQWRERNAAWGPWDYSAESLDRVQERVLHELHIEDGVVTGDPSFLDGTVRYIGETMLRHGGGEWVYHGTEPDPHNPYRGRPFVQHARGRTSLYVVVPRLAIRRLLRKGPDDGALRRNLESYLRSRRSEPSPWDLRPEFERLQRALAKEALMPAGFTKEKGRVYVRRVSADVVHWIEFSKRKWTTAEKVQFSVTYEAEWATGPAASPLHARLSDALVLRGALRIDDGEADADSFSRQEGGARSRFFLTADTDLGTVKQVLLRRIREQVLPDLDRVTNVEDCIRELRTPEASIPRSLVLLEYFGRRGDWEQAQEQYWRLRRHFQDRGFPEKLRDVVGKLELTEPAAPAGGSERTEPTDDGPASSWWQRVFGRS